MRCQKCGYISFDQQSSCGKCGVDQTAKSPAYVGTGQVVDPPFFLAAALGEVVEQAAMAVEVEESVAVEEPLDGSAALFDELEAESQGIISGEDDSAMDLSFAAPEDEVAGEKEEISLELPEEEAEVEAVADEEAQEIVLEIPEEEPPPPEVEEVEAEMDVALEEQVVAEEESLEITLDIPEEEPPALVVDEPEEAAVAAPAEESLDLSLDMPEVGEASVAEPTPEVVAESGGAAPTLDLEEIDLSDLISDSGPSAAPVNGGDGEEIFDLSSLMGDPGESENGDDLALSMDLSEEITSSDAAEGEGAEEEKRTDATSGLTLEPGD